MRLDPSTRRPTALRLEALEGRDCPACTVVQAGNTLYVLGDSTANAVVITDSGPSPGPNGLTPPELDVTADGQTTTIRNSRIFRVVVQTLGGDDSVTYQPGMPGGTQAVTSLALNLGDGNDTAHLTVSRPRAPAPNGTTSSPDFNLKLNGGSGDDVVDLRFGTLTDGNVTVRANLGAGDDTFAALFTGPVTGTQSPTANWVKFNVQGGAGNDSIDVEAAGIPFDHHFVSIVVQGSAGDDDIDANVALTDGPASNLFVRLLGGDGDDQVSAELVNLSTRSTTADFITLDGGAGDDDLSVRLFTTQPTSDTTVAVNGGSGFDEAWVPIGFPLTRVKTCEQVFFV